MEKTAWMALALEQAHAAMALGDVPVGAVVVQRGRVMAVAGNEVMHRQDPTAHAEILAIQRAAQKTKQRFLDDCDLYVTLEPCPMCCHAIALARVRRLYFGAYDPKGGAVEHGPRLLQQPGCFHKPDVIGGVQERACSSLLTGFFRGLRTP